MMNKTLNHMELKQMKCVPCEGGVKPLKGQAIADYMHKLDSGWVVIGDKMIRKEFPFKNFNLGMAFLNKIAAIADQEGHHPDVCISYTKVQVELFTHAINGLSENDFIMAAKIDDVIKH
jgi:4a-hydroxytetrahydrobiopterin dehydratase